MSSSVYTQEESSSSLTLHEGKRIGHLKTPLMVARGEGAGDWVGKGEGLRGTELSGAVTGSLGNGVGNSIVTVWCQVGTSLIGDVRV